MAQKFCLERIYVSEYINMAFDMPLASLVRVSMSCMVRIRGSINTSAYLHVCIKHPCMHVYDKFIFKASQSIQACYVMSWSWVECCYSREAQYEIQDGVSTTVQILTKQRRLHNPLADLSLLMLNYNPNNSYSKSYKTGKRLGHGSFGTVYRTKSLSADEERAVKIIKKRDLDVDSVETEIEAIMYLEHPNIVRFYQYFEDRQSVYAIMELCTGGDFSELFDSNRQEWPHLFRDVLRAIAYCHEQGTVHRDLKFANCLLCPGPLRRIAKVIDFGLAAIRKQGNPEEEWIVDNVGSALFAAPEVFSAGSKYGPKCDLWSVGVMLYTLLTDEHPFAEQLANTTRADFYRQVVKGQYRQAPLLRKHAGKELCTFLSHVLVKDPHRRIDAQTALDQEAWVKQGMLEEQRRASVLIHGRMTSEDIAQRISSFENANRFDRVVMTITAHLSKAADLEDMRVAFADMDVNGDGKITKDEIKQGVLKFDEQMSRHKAQDLLEVVDNHPDHYINYDEWLTALMNPADLELEGSMKELFNYFDFDASGTLSQAELTKVVGKAEANKIFQECLTPDESHQKKLTWEDFKRIVHRVAMDRLKAEGLSKPTS